MAVAASERAPPGAWASGRARSAEEDADQGAGLLFVLWWAPVVGAGLSDEGGQ
jgi:hypothetical protein